MTGRRRVLWVTDEPPDRALGGGSIRQSYLLEALAQRFETDLLTVGAPPDARVRELVADVVELPDRRKSWTEHPIRRRALGLGIAVASRHPSAVYPTRVVRRDLASTIAERRGRYALVCVEHEALAPLIPTSRAEPWLITFHHLLSGMIEDDLVLAPGRRQHWFRSRDLRKAVALERAAVTSYDRCLVCSQEDASALAATAGTGATDRIRVIPNGVDLDRLHPTPLPSEPSVLLPGRLAWPPNVDGAVWFCSEVWPRIRAALPDATLELVGRDPAPAVLQLGRLDGVTVHANVSSMVPYFEASRAVIVPVRVGTGTRLKALEGMSAGRPVIGTTVGMGGIGAIDGVHALIADEPGAFAAALTAALRDDELARSLAREGRRYIEERFGWERIGAEFVAAVSELISGKEAREPARASRSEA